MQSAGKNKQKCPPNKVGNKKKTEEKRQPATKERKTNKRTRETREKTRTDTSVAAISLVSEVEMRPARREVG